MAIEYGYNEFHGVEFIRHLDAITQPGPLAILEAEYTNDVCGLVDLVEEDGLDGSATMDYTYDSRGRLASEERTGARPYHFTYTYDAGGNRETKTDQSDPNNHRTTQYDYDGSNNRLDWHQTVEGATGHVLEQVEYEYAEGDAAGNVRRVVRRLRDLRRESLPPRRHFGRAVLLRSAEKNRHYRPDHDPHARLWPNGLFSLFG